VDYFIEAVDSLGQPTGDYEVGKGTYSGANTLTRTTVEQSSNAGAAVNFAAGSKNVGITVSAAGFNRAYTALNASSAAVNGYRTYPDGMIEQWGLSGVIAAGATGTINLPIAFTTAFYSTMASFSNAAGGQSGNPFNVYPVAASLTQLQIINGGTGPAQYFWRAIGK
jgi:hypothetical protein